MDELNGKQAEFARLRACGYSQSDAFRLSHDVKRMKAETVHQKASRLAADSNVKARIRELLREARIEDIVSVGEAVKFILEGRERAIAAGNSTAEAAFTLQITKITGMNRESVLVGAEKSETDEQLIARLAQGDEKRAALLRELIGRDSFGDGEKDD